MNHNRHDTTLAWYRKPAMLGLLAIGGTFAVYLVVQNWEQTAPYLPWLLILAMPLLHIFMHGGHGGHGGTGGCGGHGGGHDREERAGHQHGSDRSLPAAPAPNAGEGRDPTDDQPQRGAVRR